MPSLTVECHKFFSSTVSFYKRTSHEPSGTTLAPSSLFRVGKMDHKLQITFCVNNCRNRHVNASEAGGDLALIQTPLIFSFKCQLVSITTAWFTQRQQRQQWGFIKPRSPTASLPFKGRVIEQTTVKWSMRTYLFVLLSRSSIKICKRIPGHKPYSSLLTEELNENRTKLPHWPRIPGHA